MYRYLLFLIGLNLQLAAQPVAEVVAVKAPIEQLFEGMRLGDSSLASGAFLPSASLYTASESQSGQPVLRKGDKSELLKQISQAKPGQLNEQVQYYEVRIDGRMASVWAPYLFYVDETLHHCGTNAFQLFKAASGWKIAQVTDTRRQENCEESRPTDKANIQALLDDWHRAAARADAAAFFGAMSKDAIYLGTDASERWQRDELREWTAFAFERDVAWAFRPYQRQLYYSADGSTVWFEEMLDTENMGTCRGSGVLSQTGEGWKIRHYDLAVMVPNEKMEDFQELMEGGK